MTDQPLRVFISYAHESDALRQSVWALARYLRSEGVHVLTNHPYENRAPREGWRAWMQQCVEDTDAVLIVCTPAYKASFEKRDAGQPGGYGRTWESALISQELYERKLQNHRFIPILPDGGKVEDIPVVLRDFYAGLAFPSQCERIFRTIVDDIPDPNAGVQPYRRRPPGLLIAEDGRLAPDLRDVYGRAEEVEQVVAFLNGADRAAQVVAQVTGTGGIGKTEVCKRALRTWLQQNPGSRVFWVSVPDGASPEMCADAIARALGYENLENIEQLFRLLKPGIYYLDNLESLDSPEGNAFLRRLQEGGSIRLLASSRARLDALGRPIEIEALPPDAALQTFQSAWTGRLDEVQDTAALRDFLSRDLGGHPLAIALVAALGDWKSLPTLMADWRAQGTALAHNESDPTRRGSLTVSLRLTSDAVAQRHPGALLLWTVAALFPDGIDAATLAAVKAIAPQTDDEALRLLTRHRVLRREGEVYRMLPTLARFALDRAQQRANGFDWTAARNAVLPFFLALAQAADSIASTEEALAACRALLERFSALHRFLLELCRETPPNADVLALFQNALRNQYQFSAVLGREIAETLEKVFAHSSQHQAIRANTLRSLGDLESRLGLVEQARARYEQALGLYQKEQADLGRANTLRSLGDLEVTNNNPSGAAEKYAEALQLYEREQDPVGQTSTYLSMALLARFFGPHGQPPRPAQEWYDQALAIARQTGVAYYVEVVENAGRQLFGG
ncbi:MAG: TIR domain-containing protein [Saprospiraceae bacterium]|nr:TIR domain-containing protein [Saprospiraceae bacterium]MDW8484398.1 TIR domain-containing protein [Saprospiraceae bacterium]